MSDLTRMIETTCYLTLEPRFSGGSNPKVVAMAVTKVRQSPPKDREPCVKLHLRLPARAFAPLAPEVTIEVPEDSLVWPEPEVTVVAEPER